jgi:hypothetical protein
MVKKKKECTETNASAATATIAYPNQYNATIDDCIKFCLEKARDDKNNTDMYLRIIKHLLDKSPVEWHYHQQPYFPHITYTNDNDKKHPDWDINKVYCGMDTSNREDYASLSLGGRNESING